MVNYLRAIKRPFTDFKKLLIGIHGNVLEKLKTFKYAKSQKAFSKVWVIILVLIFIVGGILAWRYLRISKEETKLPEKIQSLGPDIYEKSTVSGYVKEQDIYYKGEFLKKGFHEVEDYCYIDHPSKPVIKGNSLKEYFVVNGRLSFFDRECNCTNGACVRARSVTTCMDTDGGRNIYVKGKIIGKLPGEDFSEFEDHCSESGSMLMEGFCSTSLNYYSDWILCPAGCEDGRCINGTPKFLPANWPLDKCYDSDGGNNPYVKGETYGDYVGDIYDTFAVHKDHCQNEDQLNEGFCLDDKRSSGEGIRCSCLNGVCIK